MVSERARRQVDRFLTQAEGAMAQSDWAAVRSLALNVLRLDPENPDALTYLAAAEREPQRDVAQALLPVQPAQPAPPTSFAGGRYQVVRFLGEGGKKKVYLAHDNRLDRDVAFALIKAEGLDHEGLHRITREAQAMGKLGDHPHIVPVFDIGEEGGGQPHIVTQLMPGGDVEGLLEKAPDHRLELDPRAASGRPGLPSLGARPRSWHRSPRPQARQHLVDRRRDRQDW